jgi:hypothetical protein
MIGYGDAMHIIVEGMDGTGKTTLIKSLVDRLGMVQHPKASTPLGGPVKDLDDWVDYELLRRKEPGIYDRHPVISEPVYGTIVRGVLPGMFNHPGWVRRSVNRLVRSGHAVVWCVPPWDEVRANTGDPSQHMVGVTANALMLYNTYRVLSRGWWPGDQYVYDYTCMTPENVLTWFRLIDRDGEYRW